jgi:biopolymer transport protein ExbB
MWGLFVKGGLMMYPLALFSVLGGAVILEKLINLRNRKVLTPEIIHSIEALRSPSDIPMAIRTCERHSSPLAHIVKAGLEEAQSPGGDARVAMVAAASPLTGLLGTVLGMIKVFSVISIAGVGEAGLLSGGIAEALITTGYGLFIGIPALVAYNFFDSRVDNFVIKIEANSHLLLKRLAAMKAAGPAELREFSDAT